MVESNLIEKISALGKERYAPKGTFLLRQGDHSDHFFIVIRGIAKAYYDTVDGREFIKSFIRENECIASMQVLMARNPSPFNLMTVEDSQLLEVRGERLKALIEQSAEVSSAFTSMLMKLAMKKERREYELLCLSAEQRYLLFCEREPELIRRLSQVDIARYLGITPVALSRIRNRLNVQPPSGAKAGIPQAEGTR